MTTLTSWTRRFIWRPLWGCFAGLLLVGCGRVVPVVQVTEMPSVLPTALSVTPTATAAPTPVPTVSLGFLTTPGVVTPTVTIPSSGAAFPPTPFPRMGDLPGRVIPEPLGVNIHFTQPDPGEMALLEALGVRFVRMDLFWHLIEREPGQYDFSDYDGLVSALSQHDIRVVFILDYGNDLYGGGGAAHYSEEGQAAFARFAAAAVSRYRSKGVIWEIWNEPNLDKYWHAAPDPVGYAQMASTVVGAIRRVDPTAWIVGPATSGFPWEYIAALADQGVLNRLDAVTVHPYRLEEPESAWQDYVRLRGILDRASPDRKIPIISGEWGYTTVEQGPTEEDQARYLTRQWLFHLASDVDLSIWYDWRNDGSDPHEVEHNFGIVTADLVPKMAYQAAQTLISTLDGYSFQRRIPMAHPEDYLLLLRNGEQAVLAAWTAGSPYTVTLPLFCEAEVIAMDGSTHHISATADGLAIPLETSPHYVILSPSETILRLAAWRPSESISILPHEGSGRVLFEVENPFHEALQGEIQITAEGQVLGSEWVQVRPGESAKISVPVKADSARAEIVPATAVFITPDSLPLQQAVIWLHQVSGE